MIFGTQANGVYFINLLNSKEKKKVGKNIKSIRLEEIAIWEWSVKNAKGQSKTEIEDGQHPLELSKFVLSLWIWKIYLKKKLLQKINANRTNLAKYCFSSIGYIEWSANNAWVGETFSCTGHWWKWLHTIFVEFWLKF